jgi:F0F1-type ATP synthase assembly protein I
MENIQKNLWDMNFFEKFKNFLKEKFGISIPEWHSIVIGGISGIIGGYEIFLPLILFVVSGKKLTGHLKDFRKEIGYGMATFLSIEILQRFLIPLI